MILKKFWLDKKAFIDFDEINYLALFSAIASTLVCVIILKYYPAKSFWKILSIVLTLPVSYVIFANWFND